MPWAQDILFFSSFFQFRPQKDPYLHTVNETGAFVIPAECTQGINDSVHLLQGHPVHSRIEGVEVSLNLCIIHVLNLAVGFIKQRQNGIAVAKIRRIFCDVCC